MSDNVIQLASVHAKTLDKKYKNQRYKLEYIVGKKKWKWTTYFVTTSTYSDEANTLADAQKAAEKHIDNTLKIRGK